MISSKLFLSQQKKKENIFFIFLLFLLSLFSLFSFFPEFRLYAGLDAYFHYNRILILMDSIRDGTFPVYLDSAGANGYGYGTPLFYSDFLLIPFALIASITNIVLAHKVLIFCLSFFCGYFTFIAAYRISKSRYVGYLTAILLSFSYYRLWGMSHRFALGEAFSFVFIPLVAWGMYEIISGQHKRWYILSLGFALLMLSHLLTSTLTGVILFPIVLFNIKKILVEKERLLAFIKAIGLTLLLSAYSVLPLIEQSWSNNFNLDYMIQFINPALTKLDYFTFTKGFVAGFFVEGIDEDVFPGAQGAGLILTVLVLLRIFFVRGKNNSLKIADICSIYGFILLIATCQIFPWGRFPFTLLNVIQFPWRLAEYTTFFWAFAGAIYLSVLANTYIRRIKVFIVIVIATLVLISITSFNFRNLYKFETMSSVPSRSNTYHLGGLEYLPLKYVFGTEYSIDQIANRKEGVITKNKQTKVSDYSHVKSNIKFKINTGNTTDSIFIPLLYYKGYKAVFNEDVLPITQSNIGQLQLVVKGKGIVNIDFEGTFIQKYSLYITLLGFILLIGYIIFDNRKRRYVNSSK